MVGEGNSLASTLTGSPGPEEGVSDRETDYGPTSNVALALNDKGYPMPKVHNRGKKAKNDKETRNKKGEKSKPKVEAPKEKDNDDVFALAKQMKQMTMMDFKHLSKAKAPETPEDGLEDINELYAKDPLDKTRECTIQEVMMMFMNMREENYTEQVNMERRFHQLLKAKDTKIDAQSSSIGALQKKL